MTIITGIRIKILEYVETGWGYPGWVNCTFNDAWNKQWFFIEKIPIVTAADVWAKSIYPTIGFMAGKIVDSYEINNQKIVKLNTYDPWGIEVEGQHLFDFFEKDIIGIYWQ